MEGIVDGGRFKSKVDRGGVALGRRATGWDGEVSHMEGAVKVVRSNSVRILSVSRAVIITVCKVSRGGMETTRRFKEMVALINESKKELCTGAVGLVWVKAHIGISGNE